MILYCQMLQSWHQCSTELKIVKFHFFGPMYSRMSQKREKRIKLLKEIREIVGKGVETDRDVIDRDVRRENRKLRGILKEIEEWQGDLEQMQKLVKAQHRLDEEKRKEAEYAAEQRRECHQ